MTAPAGGTAVSAVVDAIVAAEKYGGRAIVVKVGGSTLQDQDLQDALARDVAALRRIGVRLVLVHGGGPQIDHELARLGVQPQFRDGLRVTTAAGMDVVRMVLTGRVQRELVSRINHHGRVAVGLSGEDAGLVGAKLRDVGLGRVGDVAEVDPTHLTCLLDAGLVPVVSSIAKDLSPDAAVGAVLNVNADTFAAELAAALRATALLVLTDVAGLRPTWTAAAADPVAQIGAAPLRTVLPAIGGGMQPKMAACLRAVEAGVPVAHVVDGRRPHALASALLCAERAGTRVLATEGAT